MIILEGLNYLTVNLGIVGIREQLRLNSEGKYFFINPINVICRNKNLFLNTICFSYFWVELSTNLSALPLSQLSAVINYIVAATTQSKN